MPDLHARIANDVGHLGGRLECLVCGRRQNLGDIAHKLRNGWPKCCGYTMRWWTQRQIDSCEAPR